MDLPRWVKTGQGEGLRLPLVQAPANVALATMTLIPVTKKSLENEPSGRREKKVNVTMKAVAVNRKFMLIISPCW